MSPLHAFTAARSASVRSKFHPARTPLTVVSTPGPLEPAAWQTDLALDVEARDAIVVALCERSSEVAESRVNLRFPTVRRVRYLHRLDLLAGYYSFLVTSNGATYAYPLDVPASRSSALLRAAGREAPFEFDGRHLVPSPNGSQVILVPPRPSAASWVIRRGFDTAWKATTPAAPITAVSLPVEYLHPESYTLEAAAGSDSHTLALTLGPSSGAAPPVISSNANLSRAARLAFLGHQHLLRGPLDPARRLLEAAGPASVAAAIELSRFHALQQNYDAARARLRPLLARDRSNFDALSVPAFIEAGMQDYPVAANLYRRALAQLPTY